MIPAPLNFTQLNTVDHYENFPVASWLLPKKYVPAVQALYRFARAADDIADEGNAPYAQRATELSALHAAVVDSKITKHPLVKPLSALIDTQVLPRTDLLNLLSAFSQDAKQDHLASEPRFETQVDLLDYCSRSANPIGRMMLRITESPYTAQTELYSDHICTALQLINFWQDLAVDALRDRCYIPNDVFQAHDSPSDGKAPNFQTMMAKLCQDAEDRLEQGAPLLASLKGRFKTEIALCIAGGRQVLRRLASIDYQVTSQPIRLGIKDAPSIAWHAGRLILKHRTR